jgi:hypothetical protein
MKKQTVWRRARPSAWVPMAAVLAATCMPQDEALAQGRHDTLVLSGQAAPGLGAGTFSTSFSNPLLNDAGQTAFVGGLSGSSTQGIFRSNPGSALTAIALQGQSAPGAGSGTFFGSFSGLAFNATGQIAFPAFITGGSSSQGIYRSSSTGALTTIALQGQSAPGAGLATLSSFSFTPDVNDAGQTAFLAFISGGSAGIYRSSSGSTLTALAVQGQSAPGTVSGTTFFTFERPVINDSGQTAFFAGLNGAGGTQGIYRSSSTNVLTPIALQGQSAVGTGGGGFSFLDDPLINNAGQTAFLASVTGGTSSGGLFRSNSGNALTAVALLGQSAPGAGGGTFTNLVSARLNDAGQMAFSADISGGSTTQGIFRSSSGSALTAIALLGQSAPGAGAGTFSTFFTLAFNETGQTAFLANISGGSSSRGLFLADGRETVAAQLHGAALAGKTVSNLSMGSSSLNRHGQLAYSSSFTDGSQGNFLFTPALRWRETFGSNWDTADRWTLGITPGSVHDVSIDPSVALTVTGPAGAVNVRSLTVGGGTAFATLSLGGGTLTSASAVQIASRGILTGSGTIATQVVNAGEVLADNLILGGGLVNNGTVSGAAIGNQRIDTNLTNAALGVVRVDGGEVLKLVGATHSNAGTFDLNGGEMQVTGTLTNGATGRVLVSGGDLLINGAMTNSAAGRIVLDDARLQALGGLTNNGQMQVTFGESAIFGSIITNSGGKLILSGNSATTFFDLIDVKSGGELRVSTGSNAVFFGQVLQRTGSLFTGTGTKFYEGGLAIGGSPGLGRDSGDVSFGAGNLYLAEIGGTALGDAAGDGIEFDRYVVAGELSLGGTLKLISWDGFVGQAGQTFDLFDWGTLTGGFDDIDSSGFVLAAGTTLDISTLYEDGAIRVAAVPEPETWALLLAGLGLLGFAARRRGVGRV